MSRNNLGGPRLIPATTDAMHSRYKQVSYNIAIHDTAKENSTMT